MVTSNDGTSGWCEIGVVVLDKMISAWSDENWWVCCKRVLFNVVKAWTSAALDFKK